MAAILRFVALAASLLATAPCIVAETRTFTDSAGRLVAVPTTIERGFLPARYANLPELG
ncbi:MAG: hypothetical protein ACR2FI_11260 [Burkholderiales bacterium]